MTKTDIKCFSVPQGSFSAEIVNPFNGKIPAELVCGIIDSKAYHGHYGLDSLKFEHCHLRAIQCLVDGSDLGQSPINLRYGNSAVESTYIDGYNSLKGFGGTPNTVPFSMDDYYNGRILYRFLAEEDDILSNMSQNGGMVIPLKRSGNLKLNLHFDKALEAPKMIMLFGQFASGFKITANRDVLLASG